jgi:T-complex protein 1 subunit zeta
MIKCPQGYEVAKKAVLEFLEKFKEKADVSDREILTCIARTSLRTKLKEQLADQLTDIVTDAVLTIRTPDEPIDLFMVCLVLERPPPNNCLSTCTSFSRLCAAWLCS